MGSGGRASRRGSHLSLDELTAAFQRFKVLADTRRNVTLNDVFEEVAA